MLLLLLGWLDHDQRVDRDRVRVTAVSTAGLQRELLLVVELLGTLRPWVGTGGV